MNGWTYSRLIRLNMISLYNSFVPEIKKRGFGRIIFLTPGIKDIPQLLPYSVSKAAVDKYTCGLAAELRDTNVLVNYLDPGWLTTGLVDPNADNAVETGLQGAPVPALLEDNVPTGHFYAAQDYKVLEF